MLTLSFIWSFLPNIMSVLSFSVFFAMGNILELENSLEMIILFQWMRDDFNKVMNMREYIADLQISLKRFEDYLGQDEVLPSKIVHQMDKDSEYSLIIKDKSFTWGLYTEDIDE